MTNAEAPMIYEESEQFVHSLIFHVFLWKETGFHTDLRRFTILVELH